MALTIKSYGNISKNVGRLISLISEIIEFQIAHKIFPWWNGKPTNVKRKSFFINASINMGQQGQPKNFICVKWFHRVLLATFCRIRRINVKIWGIWLWNRILLLQCMSLHILQPFTQTLSDTTKINRGEKVDGKSWVLRSVL